MSDVLAVELVPRAIAAAPAAAGATAATVTLLRRMEREYDTTDTLRPSTVAAMYAVYLLDSAVLLWGAHKRVWAVAPPKPVTGGALVVAGAGLVAAGMARFTSPSQVSGMDPGALHTGGVYRWSRNPQYLGAGLVASGAAVASGSAYVGVLAVGAWATYRRWIGTEERHLARLFDEAYLDYTHRVRRWLGRR